MDQDGKNLDWWDLALKRQAVAIVDLEETVKKLQSAVRTLLKRIEKIESDHYYPNG